MIFFQNILLLKEFLICNNGCFGLFMKIIKRSGTCFCCIFSAWFFCKDVLYLILHLWTKFQFHNFFPFQDIKQNVIWVVFEPLFFMMTFFKTLENFVEVNKFISVDFHTQVSIWFLISMKFYTRTINKKGACESTCMR